MVEKSTVIGVVDSDSGRIGGVGAFSFLNDCLSELLQIRILNQRDKFRELGKHLLLACRGAWDKAVEIDLFRRDKIDIIDLELRMAAVILHHARDADQRTGSADL